MEKKYVRSQAGNVCESVHLCTCLLIHSQVKYLNAGLMPLISIPRIDGIYNHPGVGLFQDIFGF
jgi:hypothetical protein